jgi:hypothetical protein
MVEWLKSTLVGVVVHSSISSMEYFALSLKVKRDWGMDVGTHLVVISILSSLIIRFLYVGACSSGSIIECAIERRTILLVISSSIASIILIVIFWSHWYRMNHPFNSSKITDSALLIREPRFGCVNTRGHDNSLVPLLTQWGTGVGICRSWRTLGSRDYGACFNGVFSDCLCYWDLLLSFLRSHVKTLALVFSIGFESALVNKLLFVLDSGIET